MSETLKKLLVRDRLILFGEERLSDADCLHLILRPTCSLTGVRVGEVLDESGGLDALAGLGVRELASATGLGLEAGAAWVAAVGLARRLGEARFRPGAKICTGRDVAGLVRAAARGSGRESFFVVLLDARHHLIAIRRITTGTLTSAPVHPRDVFGLALRTGAAALIVAHNHPSGDAQPSPEDEKVTQRLQEVARVCGVPMLDHVVVGVERFYSFADQRLHRIA